MEKGDRFEKKIFFFLENGIILGQKYKKRRSIQTEDLFFRDHYDFRKKIAKCEIKTLFCF